jgi:hypothetical protein
LLPADGINSGSLYSKKQQTVIFEKAKEDKEK